MFDHVGGSLVTITISSLNTPHERARKRSTLNLHAMLRNSDAGAAFNAEAETR